jgi:hypothetical protein
MTCLLKPDPKDDQTPADTFLTYIAPRTTHTEIHMRYPVKTKLRNFRITEDLDHMLAEAADAVDAPVSRLLRDFVAEGSELILSDQKVQDSLRRRYAI